MPSYLAKRCHVSPLTWAFVLACCSPGADRAWSQTTGADAIFRQIDTSGDGVVTMDEATVGTRSVLERVFKQAGKPVDGSLTRDEFRTAYERLSSKNASSESKSSASGSSRSEPAKSSDGSPPEGLAFIDIDGDGSISKGEWSKFTRTFSALDADQDNALDSSELSATGGASKLIAQLADANGDAKISRAEWAKLVHSFTRLDANHDNGLDEAELRKRADAAIQAASGAAGLPMGASKTAASKGPTLWRGQIQGKSQIELLISGNRIEGREIGPGRGEPLGAGTFTMTGDGKSGNMDAVYTDGPRAGQVCLGVYKLDGNTLYWCVNNRGGRPDTIDARGPGNWVLTLSRVDSDAPSLQRTK